MSFPIIDQIDKLITERGSAAVLREHLSLLRSQLDILAYENSSLKDENQKLKVSIDDLREENGRLQQIIEYYSKNAGDDFEAGGGFPPGTFPGY